MKLMEEDRTPTPIVPFWFLKEACRLYENVATQIGSFFSFYFFFASPIKEPKGKDTHCQQSTVMYLDLEPPKSASHILLFHNS